MKTNDFENHLPRRCRECAKSKGSLVHDKCELCQKLQFQEQIFCDLNRRAIQGASSFECHAFRPKLELVDAARSGAEEASAKYRGFSSSDLRWLLGSERIKYQKAVALQKLGRDPDCVYMELKYHLAWNVIRRKPVFTRPAELFGLVADTISSCARVVSGFVTLLYLAPDHLHVYVESDGEKSVETVVQEVKRLSERDLCEKVAYLRAIWQKEDDLWDTAYFAETVG